MKEKNITTPFNFGIVLDYTCNARFQANLTLIIPEKMNPAEIRRHLEITEKACSSCELKRRSFCSGVEKMNKVAVVDGFNRNAYRLIEKAQTPCYKKIVKS